MNTKTLALTIIFTVVTIILNPAFTGIVFPFPFYTFLFFQIWEIPIVIAFTLIGPKSGVTIALLNTLVLLAVFPGASPTGPFYNLAAVLSMLLGIYLAYKLVANKQKPEDSTFRYGTILVTVSTALGIVFRVGIMSVVNYVFLRFPPPVGYSYTESAIIPFIPIVGVFNAIIALYTIPIGLIIANIVKSNLKLQN
jgi:riboflavin transporter FmnP